MSARATWKGLLQISLVTIPIKVFPATESSESLSFHQLHNACQSRMQQKRWCPSCVCEVPASDIVKGFEFEKGRYVILIEDELDAVKPDSTRVIALTQFAEADELDPLYIDRTYYLAPASELAGEAFAVMSAAMADRVGIGKLAIYGREYLVAVRAPRGILPALVLHTLHHAAEIRPMDMIDVDVPMGPRVPVAQVKLARLVIDALEQPRLNLSTFTDDYRDGVRQLIAAKIAGDEIVEPVPIASPPVVNLREALEQSLAAVRVQKKTPAKGLPTKRTRAS